MDLAQAAVLVGRAAEPGPFVGGRAEEMWAMPQSNLVYAAGSTSGVRRLRPSRSPDGNLSSTEEVKNIGISCLEIWRIIRAIAETFSKESAT